LRAVSAFRVLYYLATFLVAAGASYLVFSKAYALASGYADGYVSDEIYYVDTARRILQRVFGAQLDYHSYSGSTADDYFNLEHPPLGKYIVALSMVVCGDKPLCWRLPSVLEASLIPLLLYFTYAAVRHPLGPLAGAVAALAASSDPTLYRVGSVALLDTHLAFFTALSLAFAVHGRYVASALFAGLALSVKISGSGTLLGYMLSLHRVEGRRRLVLAAVALAVVATVVAVVHLPLALHFGPQKVVVETVNAVKWHTTSRPLDGPPHSSPLGWVLNENPFPLSFYPVPVKAELNTAVHLVALAYSVYVVVAGLLWGLRDRELTAPLYYAGATLAYWSAYVAGNRTLYSFYAIQLTPLAAAVIAELVLRAYRLIEGELPPPKPT